MDYVPHNADELYFEQGGRCIGVPSNCSSAGEPAIH